MARREDDKIRQDIQEDLSIIESATDLLKAARRGDCNTIRRILASPLIDVNTTDSNKNTALHFAAMNNHPQTIATLVELGARIDATNKSNATPLYAAASSRTKEAVEKLLELGADTSIICGNGMAPLHCAVVLDAPAITKLLLKHGADIEQKTANGNTAEELAQMYDNVQEINILQVYRSKIHANRVKNLYRKLPHTPKPRR